MRKVSILFIFILSACQGFDEGPYPFGITLEYLKPKLEEDFPLLKIVSMPPDLPHVPVCFEINAIGYVNGENKRFYWTTQDEIAHLIRYNLKNKKCVDMKISGENATYRNLIYIEVRPLGVHCKDLFVFNPLNQPPKNIANQPYFVITRVKCLSADTILGQREERPKQ